MTQLKSPDAAASQFLATFRGAPLAVLIALLWPPIRPRGTKALSQITSYSDKPVTAALDLLALHGYAQRHGRYNAWLPTNHARQLLLGETQILDQEPEIFRLPGSSCRRSPGVNRSSSYHTTTTTTTSEPEILRLPDEWQDLADRLTQEEATPPAQATKALAKLRDSGACIEEARYMLLRWQSYCQSSNGDGIGWPGAFIPSRLEARTHAPDWHRSIDGMKRTIDRAARAWHATGDPNAPDPTKGGAITY